MKTYKSTMIALIVLLVVIAGFFIAWPFIFHKETSPDVVPPTSERMLASSSVGTNTINNGDVVKIESNYNEHFIVEKVNGIWTSTTHPQLKIYDIAVDTLITSFSGLYGSLITEDEALVSNLKQYGLDDCPYVTFYLKSGEKHTLKIGNVTEKTSDYMQYKYAIIDGSKKLYSIQATDAKQLLVTKILLMRLNVFTLNVSKINNIKRYIKDALEYDLQADYSSDAKAWNMIAPIKIKGDSDKIAQITSAVGTLVLEDITEANSAKLDSYGLVNPGMKLVITDSDKVTQSLEIGNITSNNESYYCTLDGTNDVYTVSAISLQFLQESSVSYTKPNAYMINIKELSTIDITIDDQNYKMEVVDETNETFKFNGKILVGKESVDQFRSVLTSLFMLKISQVEPQNADLGALQLKVVYTLLNGTKVTVEAYKKDEISSYLFVDGKYIGGYANSKQIYGATPDGVMGEIELIKTMLPS